MKQNKQMPSLRNRLIQYGIICVCLYVGVCIGLFMTQDRFLYHPNVYKSDIRIAKEVIPSLREVSYHTQSGRELYGFFSKPTKKKQVVLFLHGNSYHLNAFLSRVAPFVQEGYGVLMAEYTGFGGIPGKIRQASLEEDVLSALQFLNNKGYSNRDVILYGHSLGTYLALFIADEAGREKAFRAIVLEAPFLSLVETASDHVYHLLPAGLLMPDGYFSEDKIKNIRSPIFIAHGKKDKTVSYTQGLALFNKAPDPKVFFSSEVADHKTLPQNGFFESVLEWLK